MREPAPPCPRGHGTYVKSRSGRLLAFEGLDGCGKTTQVERLAARLSAAGHDVLATREPTDGEWGRRIRARTLEGERAEPAEELRWFLEDRREHVAREIAPALEAGRVVLTDRYTLSTVAYQGARGIDWRTLLAEAEAEFPVPDLVVLLELEPATGMQRVRARGGPREAFEDRENLERVAEIFRAIAADYVARIPGSGSTDAVEVAIAACVDQRLGLPGFP
ncbi:MAG: dTMP kinase [Deltaproteobacteria bacterium]|jgi:dTMP kinase|nr:dTMP kinase [Deltaproteobacteria bacterium]